MAGSSLRLRWISQKAGYSLSCIFRSPDSRYDSKLAVGFFCYKLGARMISSMRYDESASPPWLMLPPVFEGGDMVYNFYSVTHKKVLSFNKRGKEDDSSSSSCSELPDDDAKFVGSSHGWLVLLNERNCDLFLSNPFSRRHIKLPSIHTLPIPDENLGGGFGCVDKVIISCSPDDDEEEECRAVMSFGPESRLAFCWPGRSTEWTPIGALFHEDEDGKWARHYEDFAYSSRRKLFFCITQYGDLEAWDLHDPRSPRIEYQIPINDEESESESEWESCCQQLKYLVFAEQSNQLFLLTRHIMERMAPDGSYVKSVSTDSDYSYPYKTIGFDVHKIEQRGKLSYMEASLDGLVMFIGINHSFAMSSAKKLNLKPNSIYFTDDKEFTPPKWVDRIYGGHDIGIFNYESKTFSSCYYPCDIQSIKRIIPAPMWMCPTSIRQH